MPLARRLIFLVATLALPALGRTTVLLDSDWKFFQGDAPGAENPAFDSSAWRKVDVPHDWSIEGNFDKAAPAGGAGGWLPTGIAWYRKEIKNARPQAGERFWVEFDGIMANSDVWLNGQHLGHRPSGYVSFRYEVTKLLDPGGTNLLTVRADTSAQPASRWYAGGGIYRHVRGVTAPALHIEPWGVAVTTTTADGKEATLKIETSINNSSDKSATIVVSTVAIDSDKKASSPIDSTVTLAAGEQKTVNHEIKISNPQLWSVESCQLYSLATRITAEGNLIDEVRTPFGIRNAEFRSETGFWLNGKNIKLKGVCLHQDGGAVGVAVPLAVWERRLKSLRELGVNAIRTAHTPPAPEFLDLCDRMGFLVMDEFFDCWEKGKNPHDYHLYFKDWSQRDLRDGILRDRNHPSVILYSVGNEIHDTGDAEKAKGILTALVKVCHETDPSRPVTQALFRPNTTGDYTNGLADMLDVIGTNYRDKELLDAWKAKPGSKIIGTEQGHEHSTWLACRDNSPHAGQFLWTGIDYLGESRSWPLTVFNAGLLDRAGFVQARGYERQSWWSAQPMVRAFRRIGVTAETPADPGYEALEWQRRQVLFADWNPNNAATHEENLEVYSNAAEVELLLNDQSLGKKPVRKDGGALNWQVPYQAGILVAVARTDGKEVSRDTLQTAGKATKIDLLCDTKSIDASFDDVANIVIQLLDEKGTMVPTASDLIKFSVSGPGKLIAVDSGLVVSTERFQASERQAFQGRAFAMVRATGEGEITLTATAAGLEPASLKVTGRH